MTNEIEPKDSLLGILRAAIDIEKFGIRYYSALGSAVESADAKALFQYLVSAEEKHQNILEDIYNSQKEVGDEAARPLPLENLSEDGRLAIFSEPLDDVDPSSIDTEDALKYGIDVEERSKRFYKGASEIITDFELKETFEKLVMFEDEHLKLLQKNLEEFARTSKWIGHTAD